MIVVAVVANPVVAAMALLATLSAFLGYAGGVAVAWLAGPANALVWLLIAALVLAGAGVAYAALKQERRPRR